jgi:opacity protein-like surface antigen
MTTHRTLRQALLAVAITLAASTAARADGYIVPFIGYNFGGDSGCRQITNCEDKNSNIGVSLGSAGGFFGFDEEIGYAKNFYGQVALTNNSVLTLMSNLMLGPKIGFFRPYGTVGIGLIRSHADLSAQSLLSTTNNAFGWDIGGGVMLTFGHFGVRGDIRHFHSFENQLLGVSLSNEKLDFGRASLGLILAF